MNLDRLKTVDKLFDSVHGFINLTEVEKNLVETPIFQRLHHISQLAFSNVVFPNAVHTRFSHSLGVMHIMDKMLSHLRNHNLIHDIDDDMHQTLRIAALLHDVGHFPFSHVGEKATEKVADTKAAGELITSNEDEQTQNEISTSNLKTPTSSNSKLHEELSAMIVSGWEEISKIIEDNGYDVAEVGRIITGNTGDYYKTMLLHSELDADRLDYLLRDSSFLGVSYGNIELDHIIRELSCCDDGGQKIIGVSEKGVHATEHYILARYFFYCQIIYHPKVYYLEQTLQKIYEYMVQIDEPKDCHVYSEEELLNIIANNERHRLYDFNDHYLFYKMRLLHDYFDKKKNQSNLKPEESLINENIKMVLSGKIPRPLLSKKIIVKNTKREGKTEGYKQAFKTPIKKACNELAIDEGSVFFNFPFCEPTKIRSLYGPSEILENDVKEEAVRIINKDKSKFGYLVEDESTMLRLLTNKRLQIFYLFVNPIMLEKKGITEDKARGVFEKHIKLDIIN